MGDVERAHMVLRESGVTLMNQSGLPLRSGGMRKSDPVSLKMEEIICGSKGRKAALVATDKGLPALCGVEPYLRKNWASAITLTTWGPI